MPATGCSASATLKPTPAHLPFAALGGSSCRGVSAAALLQLRAWAESSATREVQLRWAVLTAGLEERLPARSGQLPRALPLPWAAQGQVLCQEQCWVTDFLSSCLPQSDNASEEAGEGEYVNLYSSGQSNGELPGSAGVSTGMGLLLLLLLLHAEPSSAPALPRTLQLLCPLAPPLPTCSSSACPAAPLPTLHLLCPLAAALPVLCQRCCSLRLPAPAWQARVAWAGQRADGGFGSQ